MIFLACNAIRFKVEDNFIGYGFDLILKLPSCFLILLLPFYLPHLKAYDIFKPLQHEERSCQLLEHLLKNNNIPLAESQVEHEKLVRLVKAMIHPVGVFK